MNKLKIVFNLIFVIILMLLTHCSINKNKLIKLQDIKNKIQSINTYHILLETKIFPPSNSEFNSNSSSNDNNIIQGNSTIIGESGKKMKIVTNINSNNLNKKMVFTLIYDGQWLWIEKMIKVNINDKVDTTMIDVMKISIIEISPNHEKEPFYTQYGIQGIGLSKHKDFPGTLIEILNSFNFELEKLNNMSDKQTFFGERIFDSNINHLDKKNINENINNKINKYISDINKYCHLSISKKDTLIYSYSIGNSKNQIYMDNSIEYISINEKFSEDIFVYKPPENVEIHDITSTIKNNLLENEKISFPSFVQ